MDEAAAPGWRRRLALLALGVAFLVIGVLAAAGAADPHPAWVLAAALGSAGFAGATSAFRHRH